MRYIIRKGGLLSFFSVSFWLIVLNTILFFVFAMISLVDGNFLNYIAVQPAAILQGKMLWTLFTSMFMHANLFHLFVNMFSLFFLGRFAEKLIGKKRFIWIYLIAGIVGSVFFVAFAYFGAGLGAIGENLFGGLNDSAVGASGALFGLIGLLAMLVPFYSVYLISGPLILLIVQIALEPVLAGTLGNIASFAITIMIFVMIFAMFSPNPKFRRLSIPIKMPLWLAPIAAIVPLVLISLFVKLPIGNSAHLGGLVVGLLYGYYLRQKYKKKIGMLKRAFKS